MKFSIINTYQGIFYITLIALFFSCGIGENSKKEEYVEEAVEEDVEYDPPSSVSKEMAEPGKLVFEPSTEEQKKYNTVKEIFQKNQAIFSRVAQSGRLSKYKSLMGLSSQKMMNIATGISSQDLKTFLTQRSLDKPTFDSEMSKFGSALGFSLIENFGNSKDQGKYLDMSLQVKQLMSSGVVTNVDELRSKMFQAELNSKMTPTPGNENLKIEVGEDGKVYIKQ